MGTRTVRLDEETEEVLREIQAASDMPISTALKRGLRAVRDESSPPVGDRVGRLRELDLGPGGYAKGPSTKTRAITRQAILERSRR